MKKIEIWTVIVVVISLLVPQLLWGRVQAKEDSLYVAGGWQEAIYAEWQDENAEGAKVSYCQSGASSYQLLDSADLALIRQKDSDTARVDITGLSAGKYDLKIETSDGRIYCAENLVVSNYDRSGYAHFHYGEGVGAYTDEGVLKENAIVLYVTNENKDTVTIPGYESYGAGIGNLLNGNQKLMEQLVADGHALNVRFLGQIDPPEGLTAYNSTENGGAIGDNGNMAVIKKAKHVTLEGIGTDAVIEGWGFSFFVGSGYENKESYEVRNLTFRNYPEDALGFQGYMSGNELTNPIERVWVHNNSFYSGYCAEPAEDDKAEGDGSCDFKRGQYYTMCYNYYNNCHKTNLIGAGDSNLQYHITLHHNFYENCGSRSPLARQGNIHIYNSYFKGNTSTTVDIRAKSYVLSECNYYEACKKPVLIDQGKTEDPSGAAVKSYGDIFDNCSGSNMASIVSERQSEVENSNQYPDFDTNRELFYYDAESGTSKVAYLTDANQARADCIALCGVMKNDASASPETTASAVPTGMASASPETTASAAPTGTAGASPETTASAVPTGMASASPETTASAAPTGTAGASPEATASASPAMSPVVDSGMTQDEPLNGAEEKKILQKGAKIKVGKLIYQVTKTKKNGNGTVKVVKAVNKKQKSIQIPAQIKKGAQTFQVTAIGNGAFQNNKKLRKVKIGVQVKTLGKRVFQGCGRLQKIDIANAKLYRRYRKKIFQKLSKHCKVSIKK